MQNVINLLQKYVSGLTPCLSVCTWFWKNQFGKSNSANWIFSLQKSILKSIFEGYTGSKNPVRNRLKIQFVELIFPNWFFQNHVQINRGWLWLLVYQNAWKFEMQNSFSWKQIVSSSVHIWLNNYVLSKFVTKSLNKLSTLCPRAKWFFWFGPDRKKYANQI